MPSRTCVIVREVVRYWLPEAFIGALLGTLMILVMAWIPVTIHCDKDMELRNQILMWFAILWGGSGFFHGTMAYFCGESIIGGVVSPGRTNHTGPR